VLLEVVEFPREFLDIERGLEAHGALRHLRRLALDLDDLVDGFAIEVDLLGRVRGLEDVLQRQVAQVFLLEDAKGAVSSAIEAIKGMFSGAGSWLYNAGVQIVQGLINGIKSMIDAAVGALSGLLNKLKGLLPGSPIKYGPLKSWNRGGAGKRLADLLVQGLDGSQAKVGQSAERIAQAAADPLSNMPALDKMVKAISKKSKGATGALNPGGTGQIRPIKKPKKPTPPTPPTPPKPPGPELPPIVIDPKDLAGIRALEEFVEMINVRAGMAGAA
jgi:hypothetical protein